MCGDERQQVRGRCDECPSELSKRRRADNNQQGGLVLDYCRQFIGLIANTLVVRHRHPTLRRHRGKPFAVWAVGREVIHVSFDDEATVGEDVRKLQAEIAVGEEDNVQAARS